MFNKPSDLAVMLGIFGLCIITIGYGLVSINDFTTNDVDVGMYQRIEVGLNDTDFLQGTSSDMSGVLGGKGNVSREVTSENLLVQGMDAFFSLGKVFNAVRNAVSETSAMIGLPAIYWMVIIAILMIIMAVLIYTWLTGG